MSADENAPMWQRCPVCDGAGVVSTPPGIAPLFERSARDALDALKADGWRIVKLKHVRPSVDDYVFPASDGLHIVEDEL